MKCRICVQLSSVGHPNEYATKHIGLAAIGREIGKTVEYSFVEELSEDEYVDLLQLANDVPMFRRLRESLRNGPNAVTVHGLTITPDLHGHATVRPDPIQFPSDVPELRRESDWSRVDIGSTAVLVLAFILGMVLGLTAATESLYLTPG